MRLSGWTLIFPSQKSHSDRLLGINEIFDPEEKQKAKCFANCCARKTAGAVTAGILGGQGILGNLIATEFSVANDILNNDNPTRTILEGGIGVGNLVITAELNRTITNYKQRRAKKRTARTKAQQRDARVKAEKILKNKRLANNLDKISKALAGLALATALEECYEECERWPQKFNSRRPGCN